MEVPFGRPMIGKEELDEVEKVLNVATYSCMGLMPEDLKKLFSEYTGSKASVSVSVLQGCI